MFHKILEHFVQIPLSYNGKQNILKNTNEVPSPNLILVIKMNLITFQNVQILSNFLLQHEKYLHQNNMYIMYTLKSRTGGTVCNVSY